MGLTNVDYRLINILKHFYAVGYNFYVCAEAIDLLWKAAKNHILCLRQLID